MRFVLFFCYFLFCFKALAATANISTNEDTTVSIYTSNYGVGWDNAVSTTSPSHGNVYVDRVYNRLRYTPSRNYCGNDYFSATVASGLPGPYEEERGGWSRRGSGVTVKTLNIYINVKCVNDTPTITNIGSQTTNEDTAKSVNFTVNDVETSNSSLSVSRSSSNTSLLPTGNISITGSGSTRTVRMTPAANKSGNATVTLTVSDGNKTRSDSFMLTVNAVNDTPTITNIGNQSTNEDVVKVVNFTVTDLETSDGSLSVSRSSSNTSLLPINNIYIWGSGSSRSVRMIPNTNKYGSSTVSLTVSDGSATRTDTFILTVSSINDTPTITNVSNQSTYEDITKSVAFTVADIETSDGSLTISKASSNTILLPTDNINITGSGSSRIVHMTPAANKYGSTTVTLTVSDGSKTRSDSFVLTVSAVDDSPTITNISNQTTKEDIAKSVNFTVTDAETSDGSLSVSYSSSNTSLLPTSNISITGSGSSRTVRMTPVTNKYGTTTVQLIVSDGVYTKSDSFLLTVDPVNDIPTITNISNQSTNEDTAKSVNFTVTDIETTDSSLSVSRSSSNTSLLPVGNISITGSGSTRTVRMTPATNKSGSATVTLTVSDGNKTRSDSFVLTVNAVNDTPEITNIGNQSTNEDTAKSVNFTVNDVETSNSSLSVSRSSSNTNLLPAGNISITGSGSTRTVRMTPATNKSGSTTVTLTVSDGSLSRSDNFVLTVNPVNDEPTISGSPSSLVYTNNEFTFTPSSNDKDGDNLSFSITNKPSWLVFNSSTGALSGTPTQDNVGSYNGIQITVSDNVLSASLYPFNLTVQNPPQANINDTSDETSFSSYMPKSPNIIGEIKGQSSVDGGAFTYNIPISVAPGRAGMQPSISLNYNSQSGSGLAGYGWSLSASESISRCSSIHDIDKTTKAVTFSAEDKLCYNGSRILAHSGQYGLSGTVYVLERNSQVFITQNGSLNSTNTSFSLERLNGSTATFGTNSNSRVVLNGLTATLSWMKDVDEDTSGNQIEYVYYKGAGSNLIQDIYYTGFNGSRGNRQVHFNYTNIDKTTTYQWGGKSEHDKLLTSIDIKIDGALKSKWELRHESFGTAIDELDVANKLNTLSYCDGQDLTSCISTSFNFYKTAQSYSATSNTVLNQYDGDNHNTGVRVKSEKDYDGDGTADFVGPKKIYLSRDGELSLADLPVRQVFNANSNYDSDNRALQNNISSNFFAGDMDFNRDGRSDFLYMDDNNKIIIAWLDEHNEISSDYYNTGIDSTCYGYNPQHASDRLCRSMATDFNGDGNADLFVATNYKTSSGYPIVTYKAYLNVGSSFEYKADIDVNIGVELQLIDIDGDGITDFAPSAPQDGFTWYKAHWNPDTENLSFTNHPVNINVDYNITKRTKAGHWADFNGDGLQDILTLDLANSNDYSYTWVIAFNKGNGQFTAPVSTGLRELAWSGKSGAIAKADAGRVYNQHIRIFDYNNDGRQDILIPDRSRRKYIYECWNWNSNEACNAIDGDEFPMLHDFDIWYWNVLITQPDGTSFLEKELNIYGALSTMSIVDYNADGWSDFISGMGYESDASERTWWYTGTKARNNNPKIEFVAFIHNQDSRGFNLESISTGRGEKLSLDYDILEKERPVDYVQLLDAPDGYINFGSTMRVVNELSVDNGIGGQNTTTYAYGNARFHKAGRGFQGFSEIVETDLRRGIETTTEFSQTFPWSGMVESVERIETTNNIVLSRYTVNEAYPSSTEYQAALYANPTGAPMCFYPKDTTSIKYLHGGSAGNITQNTNTATTGVITTKNQLCQVTELDATQADDTVTIVKEVLQTYTNNMPWVTTSTVSSTYDKGHRIVSDDASADSTVGTIKTVTYNDRKLPETVTLAGGNIGTGSDGDGATTIIEYDGYGNKNKVTNTIEGGDGTEANARSVSYLMNNEHYFVERTQNNEWGAVNVSNNEYDALTAQVTQSTDVNGFVTTREINFLGAEHSLTVRNSADQQVAPTQYTEYDWGAVTKVQDGTPTVTIFIDTLGRDYKQISQGFDGSIITTETVYDEEGQVTAEITPTASFGTHQSVTYSDYDVLGRPASKTVNDGNINFTSHYSYNEFTTTIKVSAGTYAGTMSRSYNSFNQLLQTVDANSQATYFAYNAAGLPVYIRDVIGSEIKAGYDNLGRKEYFDDPNMGRWDFTYNEFGEIATQTDANGADTLYVYDKLGRLENRANRRFIYDNAGKGRLYQSSFDGKTQTYAYDNKGRIDQVTTVIDDSTFYQHFAYDSYFGRVKAQEFASGERVAYRYNQYGYLTEEYQKYTDGSESSLRLITDMSALGAVKQQRFGNGLTQTFEFLESGAIGGICTGASIGCNGVNVQSLGYVYDDIGNLKEQHNYMLGFKESYNYDVLHRVDDATITVNGFGKGVIDYGYDDAGNFIFKTDYGTNYQYGGSNRTSINGNAGPNAVRQLTRTNGSGVVNFAYDNNGNMTNGDGLTIDYNRDNKPVEIIRSGITSTFNYDAEGMRYKQVVGNGGSNTTTTYYIDKTVERQIKKSGASTTEILDKTYVAGHTVLFTPVLGEFTGQSRIVHTLHDRLGGVDTLLDGSRHLNEVSDPNFLVQQRRGYDVFGRPRELTSNSFAVNSATNLLSDWQKINRGFTSHEHLPESELIHMNGRVYDYNLGRFLGVDPFVTFPENSQGANPYSYIMNNPMAGVDPTGYKAEVIECDTNPSSCEAIMNDLKEKEKKSSNISNGQQNEQGGGTVADLIANALDGFSSAAVGKAHRRDFYKGKDLSITAEEQELFANGDLRGFWKSRAGKDPVARIGLGLWGTDEDLDESIKEHGEDYWQTPSGWFGDTKTYWKLMGQSTYANLHVGLVDAGKFDGKTYRQQKQMIRKVGLEVARQHILSVTDDYDNRRGEIRGLLDLNQMKTYHHRAFSKFGIAPHNYGGTYLRVIPDSVELQMYGYLYCADCDSHHGSN